MSIYGANKVIAEAEKMGIGAQEIGYIDDKPGIRIKNMGAQNDQEYLEYYKPLPYNL